MSSKENLREQALSRFDLFDRDGDGDGFGATDYAVWKKKGFAARWVEPLGAVLQLDLDGDGAATRAEIKIVRRREALMRLLSSGLPTPAEVDAELETFVNSDMKADVNNDGTISGAEMRRRATEYAHSAGPPQPAVSFSLDRDRSGVVTAVEFQATFDQAFDQLDADHNGQLSDDEWANLIRQYPRGHHF